MGGGRKLCKRIIIRIKNSIFFDVGRYVGPRAEVRVQYVKEFF
jgi:hypothetical protein